METTFLIIFLGLVILSSANLFDNSFVNLIVIFVLITSVFLSLFDYFRDPGFSLYKKIF